MFSQLKLKKIVFGRKEKENTKFVGTRIEL